MTDAARKLSAAWWPLAQLPDALALLAGHYGLAASVDEHDARPDPAQLPAWLDRAGGRLGLEVVAVESEVRDLVAMLACGGPALLMHDRQGEPGFLVLQASRRGTVRLLATDHTAIACDPSALCDLLNEELAAPVRHEIDQVLATAGIPPHRHNRVAEAMLAQRIGSQTVGGIYLLRLPAGSSFAAQLREAGIARRMLGITALFLVLYGGEIMGWQLIGGASLSGRSDPGWLAAWLILMFTLLPARLWARWNESQFALDVGRLMKSRLLTGALAMPIDVVRRSGVGQLISQVMEAQALDGLAMGGGFAVLVGAVELGLAAWVLLHGASPVPHLLLLGLFTLLTLALSFGFHRAISAWTAQRLGMTHYLVEVMVGHRTRLAQERPGRRDSTEDSQLNAYLEGSRAMDRMGLRLGSGLASAWQLAALLAFLPAIATRGSLPISALAISLGGILLAHRALAGIGSGLTMLSRAGFAWQRVAAMFKAGALAPATGIGHRRRAEGRSGRVIIEARGLRFGYAGGGDRVLDGVSLDIAHGDRILVEGPSGGGKSTLASVLTGLRTADSGLLLLNGLDRPTIGDDWHHEVSAAPQFHDNHILSGTLAFNLLMGRSWPPSAADLADAEEICEELGLGDLLRRMPGGLHQRVGETGWQLSHGERSRVFLARALLQRASLTILDESFAALDPATMRQCLDTALRRAETLMVIAHP